MTREIPKILLVDDDLPSLRMLVASLKNSGFDLRIAGGGREALKRVGRDLPDIILLDVRMPGMNGFEVCQALKKDPDTREIPILFMSAMTDTVDKVRGLSVGGADYLTKPLDTEEALARIETHLKLRDLRRALAMERDRFRCLAEATSEGICIHEQGRVVEVNQAMEKLTGYPRWELIDGSVQGLFAVRSRRSLEQLMRIDALGPLELIGLRRDGGTTLLEVEGREIQWEGRPLKMLAARDITLRKRLEQENLSLRASLSRSERFGEMVGRSAAMKRVYEMITRAAASDETVVIYGETGTGKELAARTIFQLSQAHTRFFVPVNCAAIPEHLFESLLFGYRRGAFTGAGRDTSGFFDQAQGGTLFLDEIGELTLTMQAKLLRVLQDGEYTPVGDTRNRIADARIIVATNRDLRKMMVEGRIREDFFHRIHVIAMEIPPLRWRKEDIPLLTAHFLERRGAKGETPGAVPHEVMERFAAYDWPGNVRELFNELRRYLATGETDLGGRSEPADPAADGPPFVRDGLPLHTAVRIFEQQYITRTLDRFRGHKKRTAEVLGVDRKTLYNKLKRP